MVVTEHLVCALRDLAVCPPPGGSRTNAYHIHAIVWCIWYNIH